MLASRFPHIVFFLITLHLFVNFVKKMIDNQQIMFLIKKTCLITYRFQNEQKRKETKTKNI